MRTISWRWHHEVVVFQRMIHLESLLVIRNVPGHFSLNRLDRNLKLVGSLWKWGAEEIFQERRPHGFPWELFFITYNIFSPLTCIYVIATSLCLGANGERPVRSGFEDFSTGVESESHIRLRKAIVRRCLAPLSKGRECKERSSLYQCWYEPHLLEAGFWWE